MIHTNRDLSLNELEVKIVKLVCQEKANKQIASLLNMPQRTVEYHISSIIRKFNVSTRLGIAVRAIQLGIIDLEDICN